MINSIDFCGFGDSLMLGTAQAALIPYNARIGRQPVEIEAAIAGTDRRFIEGRTVLLSCGTA